MNELMGRAGQEEFEHIRPLSYGDSHVVLICFAVDNRDSFDNIETKVPVLVGTCHAAHRRSGFPR